MMKMRFSQDGASSIPGTGHIIVLFHFVGTAVSPARVVDAVNECGYYRALRFICKPPTAIAPSHIDRRILQSCCLASLVTNIEPFRIVYVLFDEFRNLAKNEIDK
jgi:hypothetical protein